MSKYALVASYYDKYEKTDQKYKNEVEIKLPNIDLSTIQAIDFFTASHDVIDIFGLIDKYQHITGINHLAIKYQSDRNNRVNYFRVICNNKDFALCTKNNFLKTYQISGKYRTALLVSSDANLFQIEKRNLLQILERGNFLEFQRLYPYQDDLAFLVRRYFDSCYDTEDSKLSELSLIVLEFSRYTTFRKWIVVQGRQDKSLKEIVFKSQRGKVASNFTQKSQNLIAFSREEYEEEYEKNFYSLHHISYGAYQARQYNTLRLEEDKEEFLEENEIEQICFQPFMKRLHR